MTREYNVKEYSYSRKYKFMFIWLSNVFLVLLTLSVVYFKPYLILFNFAAFCLNYYLLANSFNKKIFVHSEGRFVYRNVFRRRQSFNLEDIESVKLTTIRRGLLIQLKDGKGYIFATGYWKNATHLFRFIVNRLDPKVVKERDKIISSFGL